MSTLRRGRYLYYHNGVLTPIQEEYTRQEWDHSHQHTHATRNVPAHGVVIHVHAHRNNSTDQANVIWQDSGRVSALYILTDSIHVMRNVNGTSSKDTLDRPPDLVISPLLRVFMGPVLRQIAALGGRAQVLVPDIRTPQDPNTLLCPLLEWREARFLDHDVWEGQPVERWSYTGGRYDEAAQFWLSGDTLVRYTFEGWDVRHQAATSAPTP